MIWILLTSVTAFLIWYNFIKPMSHFKKIGVKQIDVWPILGNLWASVIHISYAESLFNIYNKFPEERYIGYYQFCLPVLMLRDPDLIKQITIKDFAYFTDHRHFVNPEADQLWSLNLFALRGKRWKEMRGILTGTFTSNKLKQIFGVINETAENFVSYYINKNEDFLETEMKDAFTRYANDVIATTAFGLKVDSLKEPKNKFYLMGKRISNFSGWISAIKFMIFFVTPNLYNILKITVFPFSLTNYFKTIILETIKSRQDKGIIRQDMINILMEVKKGMENEEANTGKCKPTEMKSQLTYDDIVAQAMGFFIAGFETTSTALAFVSYELAINQEIQEKLRKEILETHKANNNKLSYESLTKMKYLDMIMSEVLRKWPPVITIDRICTKPYTIEPINPNEKPVHLKVGDLVWLPMYALQRDPKYFPNPEKFDPERFSDENKDKIVPYTYIPFGVGPRICIGARFSFLESKAILYNLLLNFKFVTTARTETPIKLSSHTPMPKAVNGHWIGLKRIQN